MGVLGSFRAAWDEVGHLRPNRHQVTGGRVVERVGLDTHVPVRRPDRWKRVTILGSNVHADRKWVGRHLLECPEDGTLVTDQYARARKEEAAAALDEVLAELAGRLERIEERLGIRGEVTGDDDAAAHQLG